MGQEQETSRSELARGVVVIVAAGIVLGLAFNALSLSARSPRGIAWVREARQLQRLEDVADAGQGGTATGAIPDPERVPASEMDADDPPESAGTPPVAATEQVPPGTSPPSANPAAPTPAPKAEPAAVAPAGGSRGTTASDTRPAETPATPPPAAALPAIPVVDHPLEIELATFKKFYDAQAAVIVDAREPVEYEEGHIAGARSLPFDHLFSDPTLLERFDPGGKPIVVYCSGPGCDLSMQLARSMIDAGFRRVLVFEAGFPAWQGAGYPVARGAAAAGG